MDKTIVLDGIEYLLVPKKQEETPEPLAIYDFLSIHKEPSQVQDEPVLVDEPHVRIVDATERSDVPDATPKPYEYRDKFMQQKLTPLDVLSKFTSSKELIAGFKELDIIRQRDFKDDKSIRKAKWGFYGAGVEADVV